MTDTNKEYNEEQRELSAEEEAQYAEDIAEAAMLASFNDEEYEEVKPTLSQVDQDEESDEAEDDEISYYDQSDQDIDGGEEDDDNPDDNPDDADDNPDNPDDSDDSDDSSELSEIEKLRAENERLLRAKDGKYGTLNSKYLGLQKKLHEMQEQGHQKPAGEFEPDVKIDLSKVEGFAELAEDDPEAAQVLERSLSLQASTYHKEIEALKAQVESVGATKEQLAAQMNESVISMRHRDWIDIVNTNEFHAFVSADEERAKVLESTNPFEVIEVLDKYKEFQDNESIKKAKKAAKRDRLKANVPATKGAATVKPKRDTAEEAFNNAFHQR